MLSLAETIVAEHVLHRRAARIEVSRDDVLSHKDDGIHFIKLAVCQYLFIMFFTSRAVACAS